MDGTSDIGMMYRQELERRGVPLNAVNMRRLVNESRMNPDIISGLRVQGAYDPERNMMDAPSATQTPAVGSPAVGPSTQSARAPGVQLPASSPPGMMQMSGGMQSPGMSVGGAPGEGAMTGRGGVSPSAVAGSVLSGGSAPVVGAPSRDPVGETGEYVQQPPPSMPVLDTGGMQAVQPPMNDGQRLANVARAIINDPPVSNAYMDPEAPPMSAPGMGAPTGNMPMPGADTNPVDAALAALGIGGATAAGLRIPRPSMAGQVTAVPQRPPSTLPPRPAGGVGSVQSEQQKNVLNNMRQTTVVDPDMAGTEPTPRAAAGRRVPIVQGAPGTPPPVQGAPPPPETAAQILRGESVMPGVTSAPGPSTAHPHPPQQLRPPTGGPVAGFDSEVPPPKPNAPKPSAPAAGFEQEYGPKSNKVEDKDPLSKEGAGDPAVSDRARARAKAKARLKASIRF